MKKKTLLLFTLLLMHNGPHSWNITKQIVHKKHLFTDALNKIYIRMVSWPTLVYMNERVFRERVIGKLLLCNCMWGSWNAWLTCSWVACDASVSFSADFPLSAILWEMLNKKNTQKTFTSLIIMDSRDPSQKHKATGTIKTHSLVRKNSDKQMMTDL